MDTNVDSIDSASSKVDAQQVLGSSNYGTFSDIAEQEVIAAAADDQPKTSAIDEFENEGNDK